MLEASCHCGAVRFEISVAPKTITECNCSICRRLGALWAYYHPDQVTVICAPEATGVYMWGDNSIEFHHCRTCGCTTHYESRIDLPRRAVNARLMQPADIEAAVVRSFDGASL